MSNSAYQYFKNFVVDYIKDNIETIKATYPDISLYLCIDSEESLCNLLFKRKLIWDSHFRPLWVLDDENDDYGISAYSTLIFHIGDKYVKVWYDTYSNYATYEFVRPIEVRIIRYEVDEEE